MRRIADFVAAFLEQNELPLSRAVSKVQSLLLRPDYDAAELASYIRADPTLAARVMRVANSAYFSRNACDSVEAAVNRLGSVNLCRVMAQIIASAAFVKPLEAYDLPSDALWRRSVTVATTAEMATIRRDGTRSAAYTFGLMHLIGILPLNHAATSGLSKGTKFRYAGFVGEWSTSEVNAFGFDHADVGAELLLQLGFPSALVQIVKRQHCAPVTDNEEALYLGRAVRARLCEGQDIMPSDQVLRAFGLNYTSVFENFIADVSAEMQHAVRP